MEGSALQEPEDTIPERPRVLTLRSYARDKIAVENGMMAHDAALGAATHGMGISGLLLQKLFKPTSFMEFLSLQLEEWVGPVKSLEPERAGVAAVEDDWKQHVRVLVSQAQIVLILPGTTPGLAWELSYLRSVFPPKQILLLNEPSGVDRIPWPTLVRRFSAQGWTLPERDPGPGTVLSLDDNWRASVFARDCTSPTDYAMAVASAWNEGLEEEEEESPPQAEQVEQSMSQEQEKVEKWVAGARSWLHQGVGGALLVFMAGVIAVMLVLATGPHKRIGHVGAAWLFFGVLAGVYAAARFLIFLIALMKSQRG